MRMLRKAMAGQDPVIVDHPQDAKRMVLSIHVIAEGKRMPAVEP
jgi:hypothetical protein